MAVYSLCVLCDICK